MARKRQNPKTIIQKLRNAAVLQGPRVTVAEQTFYRWPKEYGIMAVDMAKHLRELEAKNSGLKRNLADLIAEERILKEVVEEND